MKLDVLARPMPAFHLRIELHSDLCVGTGSGGQAWTDRACVRDARGAAIIPGSHLKGVVRNAAELLADARGLEVCLAPRAEAMCPRPGQPALCIVCQIFGAPSQPAAVVFEDLRLTLADGGGKPAAPGMTDAIAAIRHHVALDRRLRTASEGRLFSVECVPAGAVFVGNIRCRRKLQPEEHSLLRGALQFADRLGGGRSTGGGRVEIQVHEEGVAHDAR